MHDLRRSSFYLFASRSWVDFTSVSVYQRKCLKHRSSPTAQTAALHLADDCHTPVHAMASPQQSDRVANAAGTPKSDLEDKSSAGICQTLAQTESSRAFTQHPSDRRVRPHFGYRHSYQWSTPKDSTPRCPSCDRPKSSRPQSAAPGTEKWFLRYSSGRSVAKESYSSRTMDYDRYCSGARSTDEVTWQSISPEQRVSAAWSYLSSVDSADDQRPRRRILVQVPCAKARIDRRRKTSYKLATWSSGQGRALASQDSSCNSVKAGGVSGSKGLVSNGRPSGMTTVVRLPMPAVQAEDLKPIEGFSETFSDSARFTGRREDAENRTGRELAHSPETGGWQTGTVNAAKFSRELADGSSDQPRSSAVERHEVRQGTSDRGLEEAVNTVDGGIACSRPSRGADRARPNVAEGMSRLDGSNAGASPPTSQSSDQVFYDNRPTLMRITCPSASEASSMGARNGDCRPTAEKNSYSFFPSSVARGNRSRAGLLIRD